MLHWPDKIKHEFYHPKNIGELDVSKSNVFLAECKTPDGFTHMQLFLEIKNREIIEAKFKALGCPCCIACLSYVTQQLKNHTIEIITKISAPDLIKALELPRERYSSALLVQGLLEDLAVAVKHKKLL